jgi:hypothetical protein
MPAVAASKDIARLRPARPHAVSAWQAPDGAEVHQEGARGLGRLAVVNSLTIISPRKCSELGS